MTRKKDTLTLRQQQRAERLLAKLKDALAQMASHDSLQDIPIETLEEMVQDYVLALNDLQRPVMAIRTMLLHKCAQLRRKGYHKSRIAAIERRLDHAQDYLSNIVDENSLADSALQKCIDAALMYNDLLKTWPKRR